jgi:glutaredoxin
MRITVYSKTGCPWTQDILALLIRYRLPFVEKDMRKKSEFKSECINKSGQWRSPTVDIDGKIFPDTDVREVGEYLRSLKVIK